MRSFVVLVVLVCIALAKADSDEEEKATAECLKEFKLTEKDLEDGNVPKDKMCVFKCVLAKLKIMDAAGNIDMEKAKKTMPKDTPKEEVAKFEVCVKKNNSPDPCEKARATLACMDDD